MKTIFVAKFIMSTNTINIFSPAIITEGVWQGFSIPVSTHPLLQWVFIFSPAILLHGFGGLASPKLYAKAGHSCKNRNPFRLAPTHLRWMFIFSPAIITEGVWRGSFPQINADFLTTSDKRQNLTTDSHGFSRIYYLSFLRKQESISLARYEIPSSQIHRRRDVQ